LIKDTDSVEKILGEPIMVDFTDSVRKIRTSLLIVSIIAITVVLGQIEIDPSSPFFGIHFKGLTNKLILNGLAVLNIYMLIHFVWCSFDFWLEWIVRITGTRVAFVTTGRFANENCDYPNDPRQSTLYNWWKDEAAKIGSFRILASSIQDKLSEWEQKAKAALEGEDPNVVAVLSSINSVSSDVTKLRSAIETAEKTIQSARIPASLARFDRKYQLFMRSQNLRWLVVELGLPVLTGSYAIFLLTSKL